MKVSKAISRTVAGVAAVAGIVAVALPLTAHAGVNGGDTFSQPLQLSPLGEIVKIVLGPKQ